MKTDNMRWIPCAEDRPKKDDWYLVTIEFGKRDHEYVVDKVKYSTLIRGWIISYPVIAWMPMPEPYKEINGRS